MLTGFAPGINLIDCSKSDVLPSGLDGDGRTFGKSVNKFRSNRSASVNATGDSLDDVLSAFSMTCCTGMVG